ncbi:MAG: NAD-dependent deacylase [Blastocatellia bacterium]|nr:NAD-dependent deacylase [Blastocatellia bacterium]
MRGKIDWQNYRSIVVLTGAGISAGSGLPTFRGPGGLWSDAKILEFGTVDALRERPFEVWRFFAPLREKLKSVQPNPGHLALATLEADLQPEQGFTLITQNVDGLHQRAGSKNVIEYHGGIYRTRCSNRSCFFEPFEDFDAHLEEPQVCPFCGDPLRFDIVLFGELIPMDAQRLAKQAIRKCDLFLAVGTSGTVFPAADFVVTARSHGAHTILINLEEGQSNVTSFNEVYFGPAETLLPELLAGKTD